MSEITRPVDVHMQETHVPHETLPPVIGQTILEVAALQTITPEPGSGEHPADFIPLPPMEVSPAPYDPVLTPVDESLFVYSIPRDITLHHD